MSVEHLQIELARTLEALRMFVDWHENQHDAENPEDIQKAYDLAICRAKEVIAESPSLDGLETWYEHEFCARGEWCRSKARHDSAMKAEVYCVEHSDGCGYRVIRVQHGECVVRESAV